MTNIEINKFLHEAIGAGCWHKWQNDAWSESWSSKTGKHTDEYGHVCAADNKCIYCGIHQDRNRGSGWFIAIEVPDYCSSLDAVSVIEQFIIARSGSIQLHYQLMKVMEPADSASQLATASVFAPAEQRAIACVAFFKESNK